MFSEPLNVTVNAVAIPLVRVSTGDLKGVFEDTLGNKLTMYHTVGRRNRHTVRFDRTKIAPDPFTSGLQREFSMSSGFWIDIPPVGFTITEQQQNAKALADFTAVSANLLKILGNES